MYAKTLFGMQCLVWITWSTAPRHQVHTLSSTYYLISHPLPFVVIDSLTWPQYNIHNDNIWFLNDFILLAQGSVSGVADPDSFKHHGPQRRRTWVPHDYQGTSGCTLEAAAAQCSSVDLDAELLLLKDIFLWKMHSGMQVSVFTNDASQLSTLQCPTDSVRNPVIPPEWHRNGTGITGIHRNGTKLVF